MTTGQMLLTIFSLLLISILILRLNNKIISSDEIMIQNRWNVFTIPIAKQLIEEAKGKKFDENDPDITKNPPTSDLTLPGELKPEAGELYPNFNDFDDYNGFVKRVDLRLDPSDDPIRIHLSSKVEYVAFSNNSIIPSGVRSFYKQIVVSVYDSAKIFSQDTIKLSSVKYFFY